MVMLDNFKEYAGILPDDTSSVPSLAFDAAVQSAIDCGISRDIIYGADAKCELYIYAIALHYMDNRGFVPSSQSYAVDEYTRRMMNKMRFELRMKSRLQLNANSNGESI